MPGGTSSLSKSVIEEEDVGKSQPESAAAEYGLGERSRRKAAWRTRAALSHEAAVRFRKLIAAYPDGALRSRERDAQAVFAALPPEEQDAAVVRARSYADSLRRKPGHVFALQTWLRQTDFQAIAERLGAPASPRPEAREPMPAMPLPERPAGDPSSEASAMAERGDWPRGGTVFVAADSTEGAAWAAHFARFGRQPIWVSVAGKGRGWMMPAQWPPAEVA